MLHLMIFLIVVDFFVTQQANAGVSLIIVEVPRARTHAHSLYTPLHE